MSGADAVFSVGAGLVLSTDNALNLTDPNCGANICNGCLGGGTDQDLLDVANSVPPLIGQSFSVSSVNDLCVLEFDFEAGGDSIAFNYVFGSDEYLEWVNSSHTMTSLPSSFLDLASPVHTQLLLDSLMEQ